MFAIAGEYLTQRMRKLAFSAMLRQEMGWYDQPENSVGALLSRLSADTGAVQGATGSRIGAILHSVFTLLISVITSLVLEWRLGLVGCLFVPLVLIATVAQHKVRICQSHIICKMLLSQRILTVLVSLALFILFLFRYLLDMIALRKQLFNKHQNLQWKQFPTLELLQA